VGTNKASSPLPLKRVFHRWAPILVALAKTVSVVEYYKEASPPLLARRKYHRWALILVGLAKTVSVVEHRNKHQHLF